MVALILVILLGMIGGVIFIEQSLYHNRILVYQFQMLVILYFSPWLRPPCCSADPALGADPGALPGRSRAAVSLPKPASIPALAV